MLEPVYRWHPIAVHFTIALLVMATVFYFAAAIKERHREIWLAAARWNLWTGAGFGIITAVLGWLAYNTVTHDDVSHPVMVVHRNWALVALAIFLGCALWAWRHPPASARASTVFLTAMLVGSATLAAAGLYGGRLVYVHGLGVDALPEEAISAVEAGLPPAGEESPSALPSAPPATRPDPPAGSSASPESVPARQGPGHPRHRQSPDHDHAH